MLWWRFLHVLKAVFCFGKFVFGVFGVVCKGEVLGCEWHGQGQGVAHMVVAKPRCPNTFSEGGVVFVESILNFAPLWVGSGDLCVGI